MQWTHLGQKKVSFFSRCPDFRGCNTQTKYCVPFIEVSTFQGVWLRWGNSIESYINGNHSSPHITSHNTLFCTHFGSNEHTCLFNKTGDSKLSTECIKPVYPITSLPYTDHKLQHSSKDVYHTHLT